MALSEREKRLRARRSRHNYHLQKTYGITILDYDKLYVAQDGRCAICGGGTSKNFLAVDHDHKTGEVRGLLCGNCNKGLARFMDKPWNLLKAYQYLLLGAGKVRQILGRE
jgi:hypothetical protein